MYSLRIEDETQRVRVPDIHFSMIWKGLPPKEDDTNTLVSITTLTFWSGPL